MIKHIGRINPYRRSWNLSEKTFTEKTTAADKSIGFDFQYYYFLLRLFELKTGQVVGLEVRDDVHINLENDKVILIQLKHTIKKNASGHPINLTELDEDLWKTIHTWINIITDPNEKRGTYQNQLEFIRRTDFLLASNKSINENNKLLGKITKFKNGYIKFNVIQKYIKDLYDKSDSDITKKYISCFIGLDEICQKEFLLSIDFELNINDIINKCKISLKEHMTGESTIDTLFSSLDSVIRQDNFKKTANREPINLSFDEYYKKYRIYFDIARNSDLKIQKYKGILPENLEDQTFIRQLIDIDDIDKTEDDLIREYTRKMLTINSNLEYWEREGVITRNERDELDSDVTALWTNEFRNLNRPRPSNDNVEEVARKIIYNLRKERLKLSGQDLSLDLSNGQFYRLSNALDIGWHVDWIGKYK